ncbi:MAG: hypothetical protein JJT82_10145 [Legionellaceae bacterium]|nr:hypothetical protein [Legionellaceae bacterium]
MASVNDLVAHVESILQDKPSVFRIEYEHQFYWVKRRPFSKRKLWHSLQNLCASLLRKPILKSTVNLGGAKSILYEAERLTTLAHLGIAVVTLVGQGKDYLITRDSGMSLKSWLQECHIPAMRHACMKQSIDLLRTLHQSGQYHGRPSPKDIVVRETLLYWLDLEENPLDKMSLAQAQARDFWLLMFSLSRHITDASEMSILCQYYLQESDPAVTRELMDFNRLLLPLSALLRPLPDTIIGKEVRAAITVVHSLQNIFRRQEKYVLN